MLDATGQASGLRRIILDDIPWMLSLAYERYGPYDPGGVLLFLLQAHKSPDMLLLRTAQAFLVANRVAPPWWPKRFECHVMGLCAKAGAHPITPASAAPIHRMLVMLVWSHGKITAKPTQQPRRCRRLAI